MNTSFLIQAGDGNRTHVISLEGWSSTIELHPHICCFVQRQKLSYSFWTLLSIPFLLFYWFFFIGPAYGHIILLSE